MDTAFIQPGGTGIITIFASKLWPILMTNLLNQQVMGKGEKMSAKNKSVSSIL